MIWPDNEDPHSSQKLPSSDGSYLPTFGRSVSGDASVSHTASDLIAAYANDTRSSLLLPNIYGDGSWPPSRTAATNHGMPSLFQQASQPNLSHLLQLQHMQALGRYSFPPMGLLPSTQQTSGRINPGLESLLSPAVGTSSAHLSFIRPDTLQALREQRLLSMMPWNRSDHLLQQMGQTYRQDGLTLATGQNSSSMPFLAAASTAAASTSTAISNGIVPNRGNQHDDDSGGSRRARSLPVILAQPEDHLKLSAHQVFLRHQIEAFRAGRDETSTHTRGRNKPICIDQVGIRCRYCAHLPISRRQKGSTYFPSSLQGIYQAAQNMSTTHLQCGLCNHMSNEIKDEFSRLLATKVSSSGAGRPYWAESARNLGLVDTEEGIRFIEDLPSKPKDHSEDQVK